MVLSLLQAALATSDFLAGSDPASLLARGEVEVCVMAVDGDRAVLNQLVKAYVEREHGVTKVMVRQGKQWLSGIMHTEEEVAAVVITKSSDPTLRALIRRVKIEEAWEVRYRNQRLEAVLTNNQASPLLVLIYVIDRACQGLDRLKPPPGTLPHR